MTGSDSGHNKKRKLADVADSNGVEVKHYQLHSKL